MNPNDPRHGTINGYSNGGCRCESCKKANRERHREYMDRVRSQGRVLSRHGTSLAYDSGCRCPECRAANTAKSRNYRSAGRVARALPHQ